MRILHEPVAVFGEYRSLRENAVTPLGNREGLSGVYSQSTVDYESISQKIYPEPQIPAARAMAEKG